MDVQTSGGKQAKLQLTHNKQIQKRWTDEAHQKDGLGERTVYPVCACFLAPFHLEWFISLSVCPNLMPDTVN